MSHALVVLHPFANYQTGAVIKNADAVASALATHPAHVVRRHMHAHELAEVEVEAEAKAADGHAATSADHAA